MNGHGKFDGISDDELWAELIIRVVIRSIRRGGHTERFDALAEEHLKLSDDDLRQLRDGRGGE